MSVLSAGVERLGRRGQVGLDVLTAIEMGEAGEPGSTAPRRAAKWLSRLGVPATVPWPCRDQPVQIGDEAGAQHVGGIARSDTAQGLATETLDIRAHLCRFGIGDAVGPGAALPSFCAKCSDGSGY